MMFIVVIASYIAGSIPFSLIIGELFLKTDIRNVGSGNIGATNVFRINKKLGVLSFILDATKGAIVVQCLISLNIPRETLFVSLLCSVIGNVFPLWLKFRGGKGVAVMIGVLALLNQYAFSALCCTWISVFLIFRYPSVSSLLSLIPANLVLYFTESSASSVLSIATSLLILVMHRGNITRLIKGSENKYKL